MKSIIIVIFILLSLLSNANANFADMINNEMEVCEINYEQYEDDNNSFPNYTINMTELEYQRTDCYLLIGNKIIEKYYLENQEDIKNKWRYYIQSLININFSINNGRDDCTPKCGVEAQLNSSYDVNENISQMLLYMLKTVSKGLN